MDYVLFEGTSLEELEAFLDTNPRRVVLDTLELDEGVTEVKGREIELFPLNRSVTTRLPDGTNVVVNSRRIVQSILPFKEPVEAGTKATEQS